MEDTNVKRINIIRVTCAALLVAFMLPFTACSKSSKGLTNHMTEKEISEAKETEFMLLDHPWEKEQQEEDTSSFDDAKDKILFAPRIGSIVNGDPVFNAIPPEGYDGGSGQTVYWHVDVNNGSTTEEAVIDFEDFGDLKTKLRAEFDKDIANGQNKVPVNEEYRRLIKLYEAVIDGSAELIDKDYLDSYLEYYYKSKGSSDTDSYYWQMDDGKVAAIKDNIREYHLYDEELGLTFVVHVTTPDGYDKEKAYPALVMTDAVWRFNDVTSLYGLMAEGKAQPQILVTVGFEYDTDGWDNEVRGNILCNNKKEFLDFLTDNMMPFLSTNYKFDYDRTALFGHSQGGVFAHYAAFNYDLYENKPFKRYIIGSPTFWTPYFTCVEDFESYKNEYGFFERNKTYDRELFIAAGDKEDEDYADFYGDNDSTTEGVKHLEERLIRNGVNSCKVKFYDSHHYQYVPDLLAEYCSTAG